MIYLKLTAASLCTCFFMLFSSATLAQEYPTRPVKLIVPYPPGGFVDIVARIVADGLQRQLKQPFIVDNRPGASGMIALRVVSEAEPDGHTLLVGSNSEFAVVPATRSVAFDVSRDFSPIAKVASSGIVISVGKNVPVKSINEFANRARNSALPIQFGSPATGSINHILGEWLASTIGAKFQHIPYKGGAAAINALVAGEVEFSVLSLGVTKPQAEAGNVKILAISSPDRAEFASDIPTLKESQIPISATIWVGLFAPNKTAPNVNNKILTALNELLTTNEVKTKLQALGLEIPRSVPSKVFLDEVVAEAAQYKALVKKANISAE